jgi:predicted transcriptional regulator
MATKRLRNCAGMDITTSIEIYNAHRDEIQAIFRSRLLTQILFALGAKSRSLSDLREITGSSSQALIPRIRHLEAAGYVEQVAGDYALTPIGRILEPEIERVVRLIGVTNEHREFWTSHDLESIPPAFLKDLGDLYHATIARDLDENILHVYQEFVRLLNEARYIHGVTSITSPAHAEAIGQVVLQGKPVELVVSADLAEKLRRDPYRKMMDRPEDISNFRVYAATVPVRLGMTVTDSYLSLGLYKRGTDVYDVSFDLASSDSDAVSWGERLFCYYREHSIELDLRSR